MWFLIFWLLFDFHDIESQGQKSHEIGRIKEHQIKGRTISIYLPPHYEKTSNHSYPVVFFNDGQWIFDKGWLLQDSLDKWIADQLIKPLVIVGIHTDQTRNSDLIPYHDPWITQNWGSYTPSANSYSNLVRKHILPFVTKKYNVAQDYRNRAFMGASFGGLHVLWENFNNPSYWGMIAAFSPSLWVKDFTVLKDLTHSNSIIWFDIGATTGEWNYYIPFIDSLLQYGYIYGENLYYYEDPQGRHQGKDWVKRMRFPLQIFAGTNRNSKIVDWHIKIEVIQSAQNPSRYFQRINPIISLENGVQYSAANQATYQLLNHASGRLSRDGAFTFMGSEDLKVQIKYQHLVENITISYKQIHQQKH